MRSKEEYYQLVLENRKLAADSKITSCLCPNTLCDWHGKCKECVALHRYHADHVPYCLQEIMRGKVRALASVVEADIYNADIHNKETTPLEYRYYVKEKEKDGKL